MILQTLRHALSSLRLSAMSQLARYVFWTHSWHWSSVCSWVGFDAAGAISKWQPATSRFQGFLSEDTSYISVWQIYVEIERARLIRKLAKIKEEQGQIAEAAELMQEVAVCELPSYFYHPSWFWSMQVLWEASWKLCTFCWLVRYVLRNSIGEWMVTAILVWVSLWHTTVAIMHEKFVLVAVPFCLWTHICGCVDFICCLTFNVLFWSFYAIL